MNVEERFMDKVMPVTMGAGCWIWAASCQPAGYGVLRMNGKTVRAHRASFELFKGTIPYGQCVLHRCDVPACVNPNHLFLGTQQENMRDMHGKGRCRSGIRNTEKTHCNRGHELNGENLYRAKSGRRHCRACQRIRKKIYRAEKANGYH